MSCEALTRLVRFSQDKSSNLARARREIAGERAEERSLAGAVRAEDDPVLAALHAPVEPVEDRGVAARDGEVEDFEDGSHGADSARRSPDFEQI